MRCLPICQCAGDLSLPFALRSKKNWYNADWVGQKLAITARDRLWRVRGDPNREAFGTLSDIF